MGGWGVGSGRGRQVGGQGGCERRSNVFVKIQKKKLGRGVGSGVGVGFGGGGGGGGFRVDENGELKLL